MHELIADPAWRAIDFISDLHLAESSPRTFEVFARHLRETPADAVLILGDLFEVWIGDDARAPGSFAAAAGAVLREAASLRWVGFMAGNRDFLVGHDLLADTGMHRLPDPTALDAWGLRVLLTHGDALCIDDTAYQAFRTQVRSASWQAEFLGRPLVERERMARAMRDASEAGKRARPVADWVDVDPPTALAWLERERSRTLVHGHTHRPATEEMAAGCTRHVLSDWDMDVPPLRAQALRLSRAGFERIDLAHLP